MSLVSVALAGGGAAALSAAAIASALLTAILTYDYSGSTPIEGGSHFEERRWNITLDRERCEGIYSCWEVCPEACFEKSSPESAGNRAKGRSRPLGALHLLRSLHRAVPGGRALLRG